MKLIFPVFLLASFVASAQAGLKTGDMAGPVELLSPEGLPITMNNYGEREGTAVLFLSARDAASDKAAPAIVTLNQTFRRRHRFLLVGVFSNGEPATEVRAYCQSRGFNFPVYLDPGMKATKHFGAHVTPEAFLLGKSGKLLYRGSLDGLGGAMTALDSGKPEPNSEMQPAGTAIGKELPPRSIEDPYGAIEFSSELIFDKIPGFPVHHCSSITEAPNGDLLVTWYSGSYESSDDQALFISRRKKGERNWSKPELLLKSPGKPPGNAIVWTDKRNRVWLLWGRMDGTQPMMRGTGWDQCRLFYRTSDDSGVTWSKDEPFFHDTLGWLPRNLTLWLHDGTLIVPISDELHGHGVDLSFFLATKDNGATWTQSGIMRGGEQPTFIERNDGTLLVYLRVRPNIKSAESHDGGKTWSEPTPTQWKNPDAGISMRKLNNGHVLLVFNNQDNSRTSLHIALSTDEARTWSKPLQLESNPGEYSYPSVMQTSDGKIHIIYTFRRYSIKHVELNEDWFTRIVRPD
ncbi:MAG: exo-alpha-sialidase [Bryobacteraceae bacterium]|jgi:predicted neuraminidase